MALSTSLTSALKKASTAAKLKTAAKTINNLPAAKPYTAYKPTQGVSNAAKMKASTTSSSSSGGGSYSGGKSYSYSAPKSYSGTSRTYRSGGTGRSASATGGVQGPVAWNPEGLAANYLQVAADMFARDPRLLLQDLTTQRFGDEGQNQIYGQLAPTIQNANALFLAAQGQDGIQGTDAEWINWLGDFINQQLTPGQFFNSTDALRNVLDAVEGSPLRAYLTTGDALEQTQNTNKLVNAILDTGYHPLMAEAISKSMDEQARNYAVAASKAAQDPFVTYLAAQNPNLTRLMGV